MFGILPRKFLDPLGRMFWILISKFLDLLGSIGQIIPCSDSPSRTGSPETQRYVSARLTERVLHTSRLRTKISKAYVYIRKLHGGFGVAQVRRQSRNLPRHQNPTLSPELRTVLRLQVKASAVVRAWRSRDSRPKNASFKTDSYAA